MTDQVHNISSLPKDRETKKKMKKGAALGLGLFAALLLVDDTVKRFSRKPKTKETTVES